MTTPAMTILAGMLVLAMAGTAAAGSCATVNQLDRQGLSVVEIARKTGMSSAAVSSCLRGTQGTGRFGAGGEPPVRAGGPPPMGAAGPPPLRAGGPPPVGAPGPPPVGAAGRPPTNAGGFPNP